MKYGAISAVILSLLPVAVEAASWEKTGRCSYLLAGKDGGFVEKSASPCLQEFGSGTGTWAIRLTWDNGNSTLIYSDDGSGENLILNDRPVAAWGNGIRAPDSGDYGMCYLTMIGDQPEATCFREWGEDEAQPDY
ncbi:MAG: hypothetical protein ACK5LJ_16995 [Paracoccus sp. (in: a-proteobacteria)]